MDKFFIKNSFKSRVLLFTAYIESFTLPKTIVVILLTLILLQLRCNDSGVGPFETLPPLSDNIALYVSIDDANGIGLRILNANSFQLTDSMQTGPGVPWTIEFSPDNSIWYSCWGVRTYTLYSGGVVPLTIVNSVQLQYANTSLAKSANQNYLIAYIGKGIEVYDRNNLSLIYQDTSSFFGTSSSRIVSSQNHNIIYFTRWENKQLVGIGVYDLDSRRVMDTLMLFDSIHYPGLEAADLIVSPDDRFLFLSAWNWRGAGGFNSFFVINISEKSLVAEYSCGQFARLAISPDGKSVYISKAGFNLYILPPDNHPMYKYDVYTYTMHDFLNRGGSTGIVIADDNRTIFISDFGQIEKVDAYSGKIIDSYNLPEDSLGFLSSNIRNIKLGVYPKY